MASFTRVDSTASRLPSMLSALEEHDFLFQLHLNETPPDDSTEVRVESNLTLFQVQGRTLTFLINLNELCSF